MSNIEKALKANRGNKVLLFVSVFAVLGTAFFIMSQAATPSFSVEPESGQISGPASVVGDSSASGGKVIAFGNATSTGDKPHGYGLERGPSGTWNLDWEDEFDGTSLNLSKWRPNWVGGSDTAITNPPNGSMLNCEDPAQVKVSGGKLQLTLVQRGCNGKAYASGLVDTHADYTFNYGYVETYMNMPAATGSTGCANWPGFWTNGLQSGGVEWPVFLESDVMECLGGEVKANVHAGPSQGNDAWQKTIGGIGQSSGWHYFGASLLPGTKSCSGSTPNAGILTYYYDGLQIGSPYELCFKNTGQFLILQNDIAGNSKKNNLPSTVEVEYARVWKR